MSLFQKECRECGCTERNACINIDGETCAWAEEDLCTFCAEEKTSLVQLYSEGDLRRLTA